MLQQAQPECRRLPTPGFRLYADIFPGEYRGQRSFLNRGHGEVAQIVKVVDLGGRQCIQC